MSDDDLDALLDEAMDMVDEQERKHDEEVRLRDAKLEDDLQKALGEVSGAGSGDADMMKMFMSMLGGAGSGDGVGGDGDASLDGFKKSVMAMVSSLEGEENLGDEDKANLLRVKELMTVMEEEDIDKANDLLAQMKSEGKLPDSDGVGDADVDEASRRCMAMLQQLSTASQGGQPNPSSTPAAASAAAPSSSTPATTAGAGAGAGAGAAVTAGGGGGDVDSATEAIASALISTLADPQFVEPIRLMRDSYGPFLAARRGELSDDDCKRYERQRAKANDICTLLETPITGAEDTRLVPLLELMNQYSELGEPPADLVSYAPKSGATSAGAPGAAA
ncbi:Peroxin 19 [Novymonas esmeraldas]|uniref:Peroxin 19 n=1 Tax=Novymonas esmeraldas TaxID=1808958 RepID=A0AAW0F6L4_9TRYP